VMSTASTSRPSAARGTGPAITARRSRSMSSRPCARPRIQAAVATAMLPDQGQLHQRADRALSVARHRRAHGRRGHDRGHHRVHTETHPPVAQSVTDRREGTRRTHRHDEPQNRSCARRLRPPGEPRRIRCPHTRPGSTLRNSALLSAVPVGCTTTWPGVIVAHEALGVDDVMLRQTARLAKAGYLTLMPDLFTDGGFRRCLVCRNFGPRPRLRRPGSRTVDIGRTPRLHQTGRHHRLLHGRHASHSLSPPVARSTRPRSTMVSCPTTASRPSPSPGDRRGRTAPRCMLHLGDQLPLGHAHYPHGVGL
jgi:hypothetical protein